MNLTFKNSSHCNNNHLGGYYTPRLNMKNYTSNVTFDGKLLLPIDENELSYYRATNIDYKVKHIKWIFGKAKRYAKKTVRYYSIPFIIYRLKDWKIYTKHQ